MPSFEVKTPQQTYRAIVERGVLGRVSDYLPDKAGKTFVVTTEDVWPHQGPALRTGRPHDPLFLPGGGTHKRQKQGVVRPPGPKRWTLMPPDILGGDDE